MRMLVSAALALQLAAAAVPAAAERVERREQADPRGEVEIVNVAGDVRVRGWSRAEVEVQADLGPGVERLIFERKGKRTFIKVELPPGGSRSGRSDLEIRIPAGSELRINTVSADQTIEGVEGAQRLQAVSGSITTHAGRGEFEAKTVSGDIVANGDGDAGDARVTTVSGDVRLTEVGPNLELNSVSGDLAVRGAELERVRIKTTNGDLQLRGKLKKAAHVEAEAINGDVRLTLGEPVNAEFDIESFNGDIDVCFGPKPQRTREFGPGSELRFKQGAGDARVRVKTLNGGIEVCNR